MIKRIFFLTAVFLSPDFAHAAFSDEDLINRSSFTATNDTHVAITTGTGGLPSIMMGGVFVGVVISSAMNGTVTFYDAQGAASNEIGAVSLGAAGGGANYIPFQVRISSGLTYTTTGNTQGITIIYKILKPF